mmetsp:Transcript_34435/g.68874  ORF Transcript_34435/g.68874 Transcript_34435/m.68874 type:complete len:233 (-) Transcript_34435:355-1053(-)
MGRNETLDKRQTEACSSVFSGCVLVHLLEGAKDRLELVGRDPEPSVHHEDLHLVPVLLCADCDRTLAGEFARIAQEVGEDLRDAARISLEGGKVFRNEIVDGHVPPNQRCHYVDNLLRDFAQIARLMLDHQLAVPRADSVQQIVHETRHSLTCRFDDFEGFAQVPRQIIAGHEGSVGQSDNPTEWRSQFVRNRIERQLLRLQLLHEFGLRFSEVRCLNCTDNYCFFACDGMV